MKLLNDNERKILMDLLLDDRPFKEIKEKLKVNKNYNLKELCDYNGKKFSKAWKIHKNNIPKSNTKSITIIEDQTLTKNDFKNGLEMLAGILKNKSDTKSITLNKTNDITDIIAIPDILPDKLEGVHYIPVAASVKLVKNVKKEFDNFCKNKPHNKIKLHSLALLEFLEKYSV